MMDSNLFSAFGISATLIGMGVFMHLKRLEEHCCALDSQTPYFTYREDQCCASSITVARAAVIDGLRATDEICGIPPAVGDEIEIRNNGSARVPRGVSVPLLGPSNQTLLQPYDAQCQQAYGAWSMGNKPDCQVREIQKYKPTTSNCCSQISILVNFRGLSLQLQIDRN